MGWSIENGAVVQTQATVPGGTPAGGFGTLWLRTSDGHLIRTDSGGVDNDVESGASPSWTTEYEIDFTAHLNLSLTVDQAYVLDDGTTWYARNNARASQFQITNGTGLEITVNTSSSQIDGATETAPMFHAAISGNLVTDPEENADWRLQVFFEPSNLDGTYEFNYAGFRSDDGDGNNTVIWLHGYGGVGAGQGYSKATSNSYSHFTRPSNTAPINTDRVYINELKAGRWAHSLYTADEYSAGWPTPNDWTYVGSTAWGDAETDSWAGPTLQICMGVLDTSGGEGTAKITVKRVLLEKRV